MIVIGSKYRRRLKTFNPSSQSSQSPISFKNTLSNSAAGTENSPTAWISLTSPQGVEEHLQYGGDLTQRNLLFRWDLNRSSMIHSKQMKRKLWLWLRSRWVAGSVGYTPLFAVDFWPWKVCVSGKYEPKRANSAMQVIKLYLSRLEITSLKFYDAFKSLVPCSSKPSFWDTRRS